MVNYPKSIPVVIVGAGPTGLAAANLLATYGVECVVLDREDKPLDLPRAIVLDDEGARTLQVFRLDEYVSSTTASVGSRYYDDEGVTFAETGAGPPNYGFPKRQFIYQPEFEDALRARLEEQAPGILHYSSEVTGIEEAAEGAVVTVRDGEGKNHTIACQYVLACDGGRSPIRERFGIAMMGSTYKQDWIVLDMVNDSDDTLFSKFFCSRVRPAVSVPAPNGGRRYEFMILPGEDREKVLEPSFLAELLRPFRAYDEADVLRKTVYTFHARIAERFREGRTLLLGDAAHLTPPFAGQGMNAGLRDAHNVAWKLAAILKGEASAGILDTYDLERRKPAWDMIQLAVTMGDFVMPHGEEQLKFRDMLLASLKPFPNVRDYLIQMRFKPKPRYDAGLFLGLEAPDFEASLVGEMIPQPDVPGGHGQAKLDELLGPGFSLVTQSEAGRDAAAMLTETVLAGLPLAHVHLAPGRTAGHVPEWALGEAIARPLLTHRDQVILIRPDRYCAAAFAPDELAAGMKSYRSLLAGWQSSAESEADSDAVLSVAQ